MAGNRDICQFYLNSILAVLPQGCQESVATPLSLFVPAPSLTLHSSLSTPCLVCSHVESLELSLYFGRTLNTCRGLNKVEHP